MTTFDAHDPATAGDVATVELLTTPAADVPAVLAACQQRVLEREGIPMFVALHDGRPGHRLRVSDELAMTEGARLAELFAHYERALAPTPRSPVLEEGGVEGAAPSIDGTPLDPAAIALIEVLVVLSDQHLRATPGARA